MITVRWASFLAGLITLITLWVTPNSPTSVLLVGFFFLCFVVLCWTVRERPSDG